MTEHAASHPTWGWAWPAAAAASVVTFPLTVVMPLVGILVGLLGLGTVGVSLARRRTTLLTALSAGAAFAVLCYLALWLFGPIRG